MTVRLIRHAGIVARRLRDCARGIAFLEFALMLPVLLGFVLAGIEMTNYAMANNRVQRLAAMSADLVAQSGAGGIGATERQIYDLFSALDLTAQPFDIRNHGRIVITTVRGMDLDNNNAVENRALWQRFDGAYLGTPPVLGCAPPNSIVVLPNNRVLAQDEIMFHVQVTHEYQPIFSRSPLSLLNLPASFTRTAFYRARSTSFQRPSEVDGFPAKSNCNSPTGL